MQLGLKNRLRLISLFPIIILFSLTSYYLYDSYKNYQRAEMLHNKLSQNRYLNDNIKPILENEGFEVFLHKNFPSHDGNIAIGQAALAIGKDLNIQSLSVC